jgi:toxin CptA
VHLPLVLALRRSRRLDGLLLALHLLAFCLLPPLALPGAVRLALALLVLISLLITHAALRRQAGCVLRLGAHGAIELMQKVGAGGTVMLDARTTLLPGLIVLVLRRAEGGRVVLPLLPDSLGAEDFRRLRLWLRAQGAGAVSAAA